MTTAFPTEQTKAVKTPTQNVTITYSVKPSGIVSQADADPVGDFLMKRLRASKGVIDVDALYVEVQKDPGHILRKYLPWDDAKAAKAYRLQLLRKVVQSVVFSVKTPQGSVTKADLVSSVKVTDEIPDVPPGRYLVEQSVVSTNVNLKEERLNRARQELVNWNARYRELIEYDTTLKPVFEALNKYLYKK
jgi:hypothetical protein